MRKLTIIFIALLTISLLAGCPKGGDLRVEENSETKEWRIMEYYGSYGGWFALEEWDVPGRLETKADACEYVRKENISSAHTRKIRKSWGESPCGGK